MKNLKKRIVSIENKHLKQLMELKNIREIENSIIAAIAWYQLDSQVFKTVLIVFSTLDKF